MHHMKLKLLVMYCYDKNIELKMTLEIFKREILLPKTSELEMKVYYIIQLEDFTL
ncbi:hypothetical protein M2263_001579 [Providencia alcalifaciens]|nr:hypothetical protein [Providencia alcalifaciens]